MKIKRKMRIRKSNSAKKLEMGDPLDVLKPQFAAKIRKKVSQCRKEI